MRLHARSVRNHIETGKSDDEVETCGFRRGVVAVPAIEPGIPLRVRQPCPEFAPLAA